MEVARSRRTMATDRYRKTAMKRWDKGRNRDRAAR